MSGSWGRGPNSDLFAAACITQRRAPGPPTKDCRQKPASLLCNHSPAQIWPGLVLNVSLWLCYSGGLSLERGCLAAIGLHSSELAAWQCNLVVAAVADWHRHRKRVPTLFSVTRLHLLFSETGQSLESLQWCVRCTFVLVVFSWFMMVPQVFFNARSLLSVLKKPLGEDDALVSHI